MNATKPRMLAAIAGFLLTALLFVRPPFLLQAQNGGPFDQLINQRVGAVPPGLAASTGDVAVIAELVDAPVLAAPNAADPAARQRQIAQIESAQHQLRSSLPRLQARELYSTRLVYNGIALVLPVSQIDQLRSQPGVRGVHVLTPKRLTTIESLPYITAPEVWSNQGATGRGTRMGIIDSGIDYTHAQFGGSGNPQDFATNNPGIIEAGSFPTAKVAGGYDFAGNNYDSISSPTPSDDDGDGVPGDADPLDCSGHGTLVAGTAAGFGVNSTGTTYNGPYTSDLDLKAFRVGPGVAPEATLYALKVLGCTAGTDAQTHLVAPAIEWAMDPNRDGDSADHLDVITIALGSPFGSSNDPDAVAASRASAAGVVVVAAAGNSNGTFYSVNSPASAPAAIAVVPVYDTRAGAPGQPDSLLPTSARGPLRGHTTTKPDIAAPGYAIQSAAIGTGNGASATSGSSIATPHVAGAAALLHELHPTWKPVQIKAALLNTATPLQNNLGAPYPPTYGGIGRLNIAAAATTTLLAYADDGSGGVGIDYGTQWEGDEFREYRRVRLENLSGTAQQVAVGSYAAASEPNIEIRPARVAVTVPPLSSTVVRVRAQILNNRLDVSPDPTVPLRQDNYQRFYIPEHAGSIYIVEDSEARIRIANGSSEPAIDVYLDGTRIAENLRYGDVSPYVERRAGSYMLTYYRSGFAPHSLTRDDDDEPNLPSDDPNELGRRILNIGAGTDVTMLARNERNGPGTIRTWTLNEAAVQGAKGVGRVRIANNNPTDAPGPEALLDVYIDGRRVAAGLAARQYSNFVALLPGSHVANFYPAGAVPETSAPAASTTFTVESGGLVTLAAGPLSTGPQVVTITSQPRTTIRVPYALSPHPLSEARVSPTQLQLPSSTSAVSLTVRNGTVTTPSLLNGLRPLLGAFELTYRGTTVPAGNRIDAARLRYAGVATDYYQSGQNVASSQIFFAIAAQQSWDTPHEVEYHLLIDTNLDGIEDRVLVNTDLGTLLGTEPTDTFVSALCERLMPTDCTSPDSFKLTEVSYLNAFNPPSNGLPDLTPFDRSTLFMRVSSNGLGLAAGASQFRYRIETRHRDWYGFAAVVDQTPWLSYDISQPAIDTVNRNPRFINTPIYSASNGATVTVRLNPALLATQVDPQILIFHFHNRDAEQTQLVPVVNSP